MPAAPGWRVAHADVAEATASILQDSSRLCGRGLDNSSSSIHEDNGRRRWTVKLSGAGCQVDLRAEGKIEFNADFTDISAIPGDGFFRLDVTDQGVRRELEIESKNGTLVAHVACGRTRASERRRGARLVRVVPDRARSPHGHRRRHPPPAAASSGRGGRGAEGNRVDGERLCARPLLHEARAYDEADAGRLSRAC